MPPTLQYPISLTLFRQINKNENEFFEADHTSTLKFLRTLVCSKIDGQIEGITNWGLKTDCKYCLVGDF